MTTFGRESAIDFSVLSPRTLAASPSGGCSSRISASLAATSSSESTPNARHMRRSVPNWLMSSGIELPFGLLEEQRRAAGAHGPVDDLRHLEARVDLGRDADQLLFTLEEGDPLAQVLDHAPSLVGLGGAGDRRRRRVARVVMRCELEQEGVQPLPLLRVERREELVLDAL